MIVFAVMIDYFLITESIQRLNHYRIVFELIIRHIESIKTVILLYFGFLLARGGLKIWNR